MNRLSNHRRADLVALLQRNVPANVFLLSLLAKSERLPNDYPGSPSTFWGDTPAGPLDAVIYSTAGGLVVPFASDSDAMERLAGQVRDAIKPRLVVGPRRIVDALWAAIRPDFVPRLSRGHRLYALRPGDFRAPAASDVRLALPRDLEQVFQFACEMQSEELGVDPRLGDAARFRRRMSRLIADGRLWLLPIGDHVVWQASAGSYGPHGTQIEAVYTPVGLRGRGYATQGLAGMCAALLDKHPLLVLHVNEQNEPALRLYERLGFTFNTPFRLIAR